MNNNIFEGYVPEPLRVYLQDCIDEGAKIEIITVENSIYFMWKEPSLPEWFVIVEWIEGTRDFDLVNLQSSALKAFKKLIE